MPKISLTAEHLRTPKLLIVFWFCHVFVKISAEEIPLECGYRINTEVSQKATLFCNVRTINNLDRLLQNISKAHFERVDSLHVQCSEILLFESTLGNPEKFAGKHVNLDKLRDLTIDKCKIRRIPPHVLNKYKDLKRLHVTTHNGEWSAITMEIHEHAFSGLNELVELNLSDNNIWSTKTDTFCSLYSLKTLNITVNHLQNLKTLGFSDSEREQNLSIRSCNLIIETLDVSYNDLIVITDNSLNKLRSLKQLLLQNNAVSTLEDGALNGLLNLELINLSNNFISTVPPDLFSNTKALKEINFSNNTINILPPGLFKELEQLQALDLSYNALTSQCINKGTFDGLPRMVVLNLSHNRLNKLERYMFHTLYSLQKLDLEHNGIVSIEDHAFVELRNLHSLTLSHNKLVHIHFQLFTDLHVLHELYIDNNKLKHIDENAFDNITTIEDLGLSDNFLSFVPGSIRKLRSLKSLDIGNNNITHLSKANFHGLSELFGLRLVDNKVTSLNKDTFEHLPQLQILNLASNKLRHIARGCFHTNANLKLLRMDGNEITNIDGIFTTHETLLWLNISENKITNFDFRSFPRTLEWLDLHKNYISYFVNGDMLTDINIKLLDLSFNKISELTVTSLPKSVEKVYLHDNQINNIQVGTFSKFKKLSAVTLNNNDLVQLDVNSLRLDEINEDRDMPEFYISGNPFVCDCSMEWLQRINYLSHSRQYPRVLDLDKAECALVHSRAKEKKRIIDMSSSDFLCSYESHCFALCHCCDFVACDCEMICPNNCRCYHDITWNANVVDCSNAGYTEVPEQIPMDATEIYLDGNHISHLGNHVFIGKKKLQVLYLNNTKLRDVNSQSFKGIESLRILHLENNELVELKGDDFSHLNNLKELYLDHNDIENVANNTFSSLKLLSILKIDDNKLVNFYPWRLLASAKNIAHVSIEGNQYSCDCKSIAELDSWLRRDPSDPEKILCTDSSGNPTQITIASVLSHCKDYMGSRSDPTVSKDEIIPSFEIFPDNYFAIVCGIVIIIVVISLLGAICYAFRNEIRNWWCTKYGLPLFKEQSCTNIDAVLDGNPNNLLDFYVIFSTKDMNFVHNNIISELEFRKMVNKKSTDAEPNLNILKLDNFFKSSKATKRLLVILTAHFIFNDLCDINFKNIFYKYFQSLNRNDANKVIFIKAFESRHINDELDSILDNFKSISWDDTRFWEIFITLVNSTDTIITVKGSDTSVFRKSIGKTPVLRYTTIPSPNDGHSKQIFSNSLQFLKREEDVLSQTESCSSPENNTHGERNHSNNSYMSIDNRSCPRFNCDLRLTPSTGHVYARVDDMSIPHSITGTASGKGRTYFV